jgi:hypothetical protein
MRRRDLRLKHRGWRALGHHQKLLQTGRRIVVAMSAAARRIVSPTEVEPVGRRRRARRCSGAATMLGSGSHYFRCNISVLQMPQSASRYVQQTTASAAAARVDAQRIRPPEACHCMRSCVVVLGVWSKFRHVISCCDNWGMGQAMSRDGRMQAWCFPTRMRINWELRVAQARDAPLG